jgi:hypothetical protein
MIIDDLPSSGFHDDQYEKKMIEKMSEDTSDSLELVSSIQKGYRNVLSRYYTSYLGPHQETVYQHSNG